MGFAVSEDRAGAEMSSGWVAGIVAVARLYVVVRVYGRLRSSSATLSRLADYCTLSDDICPMLALQRFCLLLAKKYVFGSFYSLGTWGPEA